MDAEELARSRDKEKLEEPLIPESYQEIFESQKEACESSKEEEKVE